MGLPAADWHFASRDLLSAFVIADNPGERFGIEPESKLPYEIPVS
jgi:hypothetical protein